MNPTQPPDLRQRIKAKVEQLIDGLLDSPNPPQTMDEIEEAALRLREKAGRLVAEELAQEKACKEQATQDSHKRPCPCGRFARDKGLARALWSP